MKASKLVQHTLIPVALMAANVALAHFIYLLVHDHNDYLLPVAGLCLLILGFAIIRAKRLFLLLGIMAYSLFLWFSLLH